MCQGGRASSGNASTVNSSDNSSRSRNGDIINGENGSRNIGERNTSVVVKPSRTLKRALMGTVGVGLAAGAAALLSNSDEVGEWLRSVSPHVMPSAEAGAEIVNRAIEASIMCYEKGVNVCLDAEGRVTQIYTYMSQWYLTPQQHVIEMGISIFVLVPVVYVYFRMCRARARLHRAAGTFGVEKSNLPMMLWGAALVAHVSLGAFLKFTKNELISHPAYLWQPCHLHSFIMGLCSFINTEWSTLILHVATTLWWGPFLAFVAPALPIDPLEIFIFWGQHALMLMMPFFRLTKGARWMYNDFWWNSVGFVFLTCYHWWWLGPVNIVTGVNVATMTVPPDSLVVLGKYYRLVWGLACIALQLLAVAVMISLAWILGKWPSDGRSKSVGLAATAPVRRGHGVVPGDAVPITAEKAVKLVDG